MNKQAIYLSSIGLTTLIFLVDAGVPCWFAFGPAWGAGLGGMCAV